MKDYGKALKKLRTDSNMTQAKLAEALNVTYQTVSKWENNVNMPDITVLEAICNVFGVTVDEFLHIAEQPSAEVPSADEPCAETAAESSEIVEPKKPRFCEKCGAAVIGRYCPKCGYDIEEKRTALERGIVTDPAPAAAPEVQKPKRMKKGVIAVIISVAVVAFIGMVLGIVLPVVFWYRSTQDTTPDTSFDIPIEPTPTPTAVTVKYDAAGGVGSMANASTMSGDIFYLPKCAYSRVGYEFDYWSYSGKKYYTGYSIRFEHGTTAATFTAVWKPITYSMDIYFNTWDTVSFDGKKLDGGDVYTLTCRYGEDPFAAKNRKPTTYGMVFDGFTVYDVNGNIFEGDLRYINSDKSKRVSAEANWISGYYDIVLATDSWGDSEIERITNCYGKTEYTLPKASTLYFGADQTGFEFDYWMLDGYDGYEDEAPRFADGATVSDLKQYGFGYGSGNDFVTLIAVWKPVKYTIEFDGNGGDGEMSELACEYNSEYTLPKNAFTKDGYLFAGWVNNGKTYTDGATVKNLSATSKKLSFTARWVQGYAGDGTVDNPYKITDYAGLSRLSEITRSVVGADGAHYLLTADIDCDGEPLSAIFGNDGGAFSGVFDGGHHVIRNAVFAPTWGKVTSYNADYYGNYLGLFGLVVGGEIKNVGIQDYSATGGGEMRITPLCGFYQSDKPITECFAVGNIVLENQFAAKSTVSGLIGNLSGRAENCYSAGEIKLKYTKASGASYVNDIYVAGLVAVIDGGSVHNCYAAVDIDIEISASVTSLKERLYCAPFFARIGEVKNCVSTGSLHVNRYYDNYNRQMLCDFVGTFGAEDYYSSNKIDNVYTSTAASVAFDDNPDFECSSLSGQQTAELTDLRSLDWLVDNIGFDSDVWVETPDGVVLRGFGTSESQKVF